MVCLKADVFGFLIDVISELRIVNFEGVNVFSELIHVFSEKVNVISKWINVISEWVNVFSEQGNIFSEWVKVTLEVRDAIWVVGILEWCVLLA